MSLLHKDSLLRDSLNLPFRENRSPAVFSVKPLRVCWQSYRLRKTIEPNLLSKSFLLPTAKSHTAILPSISVIGSANFLVTVIE